MSSVFDMLGPVMIGPSSSHTAGVVRIGRVVHKLLGETPEKATIYFYNSFATTYEGHGSDRAILAGLMNIKTDDPRIKEALTLAQKEGIAYEFIPTINNKYHPNSVRVIAQRSRVQVEVLGISEGGGMITIAEVDGFYTHFNARQQTLLILAQDIPGSIAFITGALANDRINIATMTVSRKAKNDLALLVLEMDNPPRPLTIAYIKSLYWVHKVVYIPDIDL